MFKLDVWLYKNPVHKFINKYYGRVIKRSSIGNADIAKIITGRGSELSKETIEHVLNHADRIKCEMMAKGHVINTSFSIGRLSIKGSFDGEHAVFDDKQHQISTQFSMGSGLKEAIKSIEVDIVGSALSGSVIEGVTDCLSGANKGLITPNNAIRIKGKKIKIVGGNDNVGVFLINTANDQVVKITQIIENLPQQLTLMLPAIESGSYKLEICTQFSGAKRILKEPNRTVYKHYLVVE